MYCLSELTEGCCSVTFSSGPSSRYYCLQLYQAIRGDLHLILWWLRPALTCVGDAIASFLPFEDT